MVAIILFVLFCVADSHLKLGDDALRTLVDLINARAATWTTGQPFVQDPAWPGLLSTFTIETGNYFALNHTS